MKGEDFFEENYQDTFVIAWQVTQWTGIAFSQGGPASNWPQWLNLKASGDDPYL